MLKNANDGHNSPSTGFILGILLLTAVAAPLSLNKVSPIAPTLMKYLNIGETQLGLLISVFSFTGIILALPGGMIIQKLGTWKSFLLALLALLIGSLAGTFSDSFTMLLVSRIVEGVGMALIAIAGPSIVASVAHPKRRGVAMGLFTAYMGIGQVLAFNIAPRIVTDNGWQPAWWLSTLYTALFTGVWVFLMLRMGAFSKSTAATSGAVTETASFRSVIKNKSLWYLFLSMSFYVISYVSVQTFLPSYLSAQRGMTMADASSLVSICCFVATIFSLIAGIVSDKLGSRRVFGGICLIVCGALIAFIPFVPTSVYIVLIILLGIIPPVLAVCVYAAVPEVTDNPSHNGMAMGLISMSQNIGLFIGPVLFGAVTQALGRDAAFFILIPFSVIGGLIMLLNRKVR